MNIKKSIHWLAAISFVFAIFRLILLSIAFSLIAIIIAFNSKLVITFNTDRYEGSGLAFGAIFLPLITIFITLFLTAGLLCCL